ncbi:rop guanine nucleotide exchange factor-like protein [Rhynchospora pubera]|uniref:Rop guanine nucleotide exchange factor-like protein n=1 Tax=Rhynchospora pubera TaxID=906938 RepID=A0AAV8F7X9_9POAL|nr:rop guanine nucleotide exchange factor-like protein [Rhynchospora pubera]
MVRFLKRGNSIDRFLKIRHMFDHSGRRSQSQTYTKGNGVTIDDSLFARQQLEVEQMAAVIDSDEEPEPTKEELLLEMALMKEKFAKLLLCEDMSGSGQKGVSPALTLSNAVTNLAASVFGEVRRLEPMAPERKARWKKEIDWLLAVADHIVVLLPTKQVQKDGTFMEVMRNQQRHDLHMGIPALRKIDAMLVQYLETFKDSQEFSYLSKDSKEKNNSTQREDDKWWLPTVKVQPGGLSADARKHIEMIRRDTNQILKLAMAINANVLTEMQIPDAYVENLPKNGRESLGDSLYKSITDDIFNPIDFISSVDLSNEHKIRDLKDRIEASVVIWKRKMNNKDSKSPWGVGSGVSLEKREQFEERAETILQILKHRYPGTAQSSLDTSKIEHNKDVGFAVLESYSRVLESLASTVLSRVEDVIRADDQARKSSPVDSTKSPRQYDSEPEMSRIESSPLTKLSDFMEWNMDQDSETPKPDSGNLEDALKPIEKLLKKPVSIPKKFSYLESLGGLRSPTISRH